MSSPMEAFEAALADALAERDRLDVVIAYLQGKLGRQSESPEPGVDARHQPRPRVDVRTGRVDLLSLVSEGELFGLSRTEASVQVLRKVGQVGRPNNLKTDQLVDALRKGGVPVKNASVLYRQLNRSPKLRRVGPGLWGLAEWYPGMARTSRGEPPTPGEDPPETEERPDTEVA